MITIKSDEVRIVQAIVADILESPLHLHHDWLIRNQWAAVPLMEWLTAVSYYNKTLFLEREAEWLANAAQLAGCKRCLAIPADLEKVQTRSYWINMTQEDILAFGYQCSGENYLLVPEDRKFAVLCGAEYYKVISGPYAIVRAAVGVNLDDARKSFLSAIRAVSYDSSEKDLEKGAKSILYKCAERYKQYRGRAVEDVANSENAAKILHLASDVVNEWKELSAEWMAANRWAAVPLDIGFFPAQGRKWLSDAICRRGYDVLYAVPLYESDNRTCYKVPPDEEGLASFYSYLNYSDHLLLPADKGFAYITPGSGNHGVIAGPQDFVTQVVNCSIPTARRMFDHWSNGFSGDTRDDLLWVAEYYSPFNGQ